MPRPPVPPPPSPPSVPPPTSYRNQRHDELEALKQRGLAKLLNKHFTSVTKSIAEERAAADAALRDLEKRKANTSEVHPPNYGELSPHDKLYLELQRKKADCKRKEKETLLLYQRYVNKFGNTGVVAVPSVPFVSPDSSRQSAPTDSPRRPPPSKELVPHLATVIDNSVKEKVERGADRLPSSHTMGMDETYQKVHSSLEEQERAFNRKINMDRNVDARSTPKRSKFPRSGWQPLAGASPSPGATSSKPPLDPSTLPPPPFLTSTPGSGITEGENAANLEGSNITLPTVDPTVVSATDKTSEDSDESNDKSIVSGLTSVEGASDAELRLIEYLKSETEAIRQMLEEDEMTSHASRASNNTSYSSQVASQTDVAAKQAETMLAEMKRILAESQAESDAVSASSAKHEPRVLETNNPDETWMVYYDENHKREYYHEVNSNTVQWESPVRSSTKRYAGSFVSPETLVPMSDFTKKRSGKSSRSMSQQLTYQDVMPEVHASGLGRSSSRRLLYRKAQRRRRKRRRRIVAVTAFVAVCAGLYYRDHVDKAVNDAMVVVRPHLPKELQWQENVKFMDCWRNSVENGVNGAMRYLRPYLPKSLQWEEEWPFLDVVSERMLEILPESLQWESKRKKEEEARKVEAELARQKAERKKAEEEARAKREEERKKAQEEAALRALQEAEVVKVEEKKRRHWACNIPFAYLVHRGCWRAARETPIFDLKELTQSMIQ